MSWSSTASVQPIDSPVASANRRSMRDKRSFGFGLDFNSSDESMVRMSQNSSKSARVIDSSIARSIRDKMSFNFGLSFGAMNTSLNAIFYLSLRRLHRPLPICGRHANQPSIITTDVDHVCRLSLPSASAIILFPNRLPISSGSDLMEAIGFPNVPPDTNHLAPT